MGRVGIVEESGESDTVEAAVSLEPSFWQTLLDSRKAVGWAVFFSLSVIMLAFDPLLINSLYAMEAFQRDFGSLYDGSYIITAMWQTLLGLGSPIGQVVGAFTAGYPLELYGRKRTLLVSVVSTGSTIFLSFFATSNGILLAGQLLNGLTLGYYLVIASTYASEVCPTRFRGHVGAYINFVYVLGQMLSIAVTTATHNLTTRWAYRIPFAVQWFWIVALLLGIPFAPESPWWLVRQGRLDDARTSLERLLYPEKTSIDDTLQAIIETDSLERIQSVGGSFAACFQSSSRRRTGIGIGVLLAQLFSGVYFVGFTTYFAELGGLKDADAFRMTLGAFAAGLVATGLSWVLLSCTNRRKMWLAGMCALPLLMLIIGLLDLAPNYKTGGFAWGQTIVLLLFNFVYDLTIGPQAYVLLVECSSTKLRAQTIAVATGVQSIFGIGLTAAIPYLLSPDAGNLRGKSCFVFAGLGAVSLVWSWFHVPDTKNLTYEQINRLFERGAPARRFQRHKT